MFSLFDDKAHEGPGFTLDASQHEAVLLILNKICAERPERTLCRISTRLMKELQDDKLEARFVPAESEDGFDFLHLYFPIGPLKKAALQLYAWIDKEDVYCLGIGTEEKSDLAIEKIHDHGAYLVSHQLFMDLIARARAEEKEGEKE